MKNKIDESNNEDLKNNDGHDPNKKFLDNEDDGDSIKSFEKAAPFTTPILFDPNIWSEAFLDWVKKFNQEELDDKISSKETASKS
ncbi:MAG: hypothetical protein QXQ43_06650 [Nitrososphaerota archaeon]